MHTSVCTCIKETRVTQHCRILRTGDGPFRVRRQSHCVNRILRMFGLTGTPLRHSHRDLSVMPDRCEKWLEHLAKAYTLSELSGAGIDNTGYFCSLRKLSTNRQR